MIPDEVGKLTWNFIFTIPCGASKDFMKDKTFWGTTDKCENKKLKMKKFLTLLLLKLILFPSREILMVGCQIKM